MDQEVMYGFVEVMYGSGGDVWVVGVMYGSGGDVWVSGGNVWIRR